MVFEGKEINGKKIGIFREYDNNDHLLYKGELLNGKRNGKGKEFQYINKQTELIFEGEFLDGKKWNGSVKEYWYDIPEFEGKIKNGKRNGLERNIMIMVN